MSEEATDIDDRWSSYKSSSRKESGLPWRSKVYCITSFVHPKSSTDILRSILYQ